MEEVNRITEWIKPNELIKTLDGYLIGKNWIKKVLSEVIAKGSKAEVRRCENGMMCVWVTEFAEGYEPIVYEDSIKSLNLAPELRPAA